MLTLYYKPTCPFCRQVIAVVDRLQLEIERKDITTDVSLVNELVSLGGKMKTPYLVDTDIALSMYESDDIVKYLQTTFGAPVAVKPRVHISDSTCISCEG